MKKLLFSILFLTSLEFKSQTFLTQKESDALSMVKNNDKTKKFDPYVWSKHGGGFDFESFKTNQKIDYYKELWYYSQSFYVKRNYNSEGITLDETIIDISRFDSKRLENDEVIISLDGFKDVIVLLPKSKLIFNND